MKTKKKKNTTQILNAVQPIWNHAHDSHIIAAMRYIRTTITRRNPFTCAYYIDTIPYLPYFLPFPHLFHFSSLFSTGVDCCCFFSLLFNFLSVFFFIIIKSTLRCCFVVVIFFFVFGCCCY